MEKEFMRHATPINEALQGAFRSQSGSNQCAARTILILWDGESIDLSVTGCGNIVEAVGMLELAKAQLLTHRDEDRIVEPPAAGAGEPILSTAEGSESLTQTPDK